MKVVTIALLVAAAAAGGDPHPTLPTMWRATTRGDGPSGTALQDVGQESYTLPPDSEVSKDNPSAMWSNFTFDGGAKCNRLIYFLNQIDNWRYEDGDGCPGGLAGVACCKTSQGGNQVEFQIPNVYKVFNKSARVDVTSMGSSQIQVFDQTVTADGWTWKFSLEHWEVYTVKNASAPTGVDLVRWDVFVEGKQAASIEFKDFHGISDDEATEFKSEFYVPDECKGCQKCNDGTDDDAADDDPSADGERAAQRRMLKLLGPRFMD